MSDTKKPSPVDRRDDFKVKRRPTSGEPDLVITIRDEPEHGARWRPRFIVKTAGAPRKKP